MSITDRNASAVYQFFKGDDTVVQNTKAQMVAEIADVCAGEMMKFAKIKSNGQVSFPTDDRMYNLEVAIFRTLAEANDIDINLINTTDQG